MKDEYASFKSSIEKGLFEKQNLESIGLGSIRGVLLSGFGGTGKSTFLKVLQSDLKSKVQFKIV